MWKNEWKLSQAGYHFVEKILKEEFLSLEQTVVHLRPVLVKVVRCNFDYTVHTLILHIGRIMFLYL